PKGSRISRSHIDGLQRSVSEASSSLSIPYVEDGGCHGSMKMVDTILEHLRKQCGEGNADEVLEVVDPDQIPSLDSEKKYVIMATLPHFRSPAVSSPSLVDRDAELNALSQSDEIVSGIVEKVKRGSEGDFLLVYAGSAPAKKTLHKRADGSTNSTTPFNKRPLFQRFIFFNDATFAGIFIMTILIAVLLTGLNAIAALQTPTRFESLKPKVATK
ncbi:hypothetical protein HK102_007897, partial [Quaeritorhiza haematococci]